MQIYFFGSTINQVNNLYENHFDGSLFLFNNAGPADHFIRIARNMDITKNFKYMVAIRPYVISPQYLTMINTSMTEISENRLEINLISGFTKEEEKNTNGILGDINDLSSNIEKSNYLIKFLESLNNIELNGMKKPDVYVSCTNIFTLNAAKKYNYKIIMPYSVYQNHVDDIENNKTIISIGPIFKNNELDCDIDLNEYPNATKCFTYETFTKFLNEFKNKGIYGVMLFGIDEKHQNQIISFVKQFKENNF